MSESKTPRMDEHYRCVCFVAENDGNDTHWCWTETLHFARQLETELAEAQAENAKLKAMMWTCGCGHNNGINLAVCACCGRRPYERR